MSFTEVVNSKASYYNAATATTAAVTLGAAVAVGDLIWCAVSYARASVGYVSNIATTGITTGTWTLRGQEGVIPGVDQVLGLWAAVATSAGTPTITATFVATRTERSLYAGAFTGNDAAGTADGGVGEYDAATSNPSVTFATTVNGDLLIGVSINSNQASAVAGSGFSTVTINGGLYPIAFEWKEQTTASGTTVVDFTSVSGTPGFVIIGAAFEPAGGSSTRLGRSAQLNTTQGRPVQLRPTGINPFTFVR